MVDPYLLEQFIKDSGGSYHENSVSWIFTCPRCQKDRKLYIRKRDGKFVCFSCSGDDDTAFHGSAEYALAEILELPLFEIKAKLGLINSTPQALDVLTPNLRDWYGDAPAQIPREEVEFDSNFISIDDPKAQPGLTYLKKRGVPLVVAMEYEFKYNPINGRVIIPIIEKGKLYGWQARATRSTEWIDKKSGEERSVPKILSLKSMQKGRHLGFYDNLIGSEHAIITEGPFDALACFLCGGAVFTMGKMVTDDQIQMIIESGVSKVYLALDPDAQEEMDRLAIRLGDIEIYKLLPAPGYKDLGEASMTQVREWFLRAPRFFPGLITPSL